MALLAARDQDPDPRGQKPSRIADHPYPAERARPHDRAKIPVFDEMEFLVGVKG